MSDQELRDALDELAADLRSGRAHPEPDALAAYHAGELPPAEERAIQDHLAACGECAGLLLDLEGLSQLDFGAGSGLAGKEEVWRGLREAVAAGEQGKAAPRVLAFPRRSVASSPRWLQGLAAALLAATIGLSGWVVSLRQALQEAAEPRPAQVLPLSTLTLRGEATGRGVLAVKAAAPVVLTIRTPLWSRSTRYRVVIERASGEEVWRIGELAPDRGGALPLVSLGPRALAPGEYRIRVVGEGGEQIADQPLHVEGP